MFIYYILICFILKSFDTPNVISSFSEVWNQATLNLSNHFLILFCRKTMIRLKYKLYWMAAVWYLTLCMELFGTGKSSISSCVLELSCDTAAGQTPWRQPTIPYSSSFTKCTRLQPNSETKLHATCAKDPTHSHLRFMHIMHFFFNAAVGVH